MSHVSGKTRVSLQGSRVTVEPDADPLPSWRAQGSPDGLIPWHSREDVVDLFEDGPPYRNGHAFLGEVGSGDYFRGGLPRVTHAWSVGVVGDYVGDGLHRGGVERLRTLVRVMVAVGVVVTLILLWWP